HPQLYPLNHHPPLPPAGGDAAPGGRRGRGKPVHDESHVRCRSRGCSISCAFGRARLRLARRPARRLNETHPHLALPDQNGQERSRRSLGESEATSNLRGSRESDLLDTAQQLVLELAPPVSHAAPFLSSRRAAGERIR